MRSLRVGLVSAVVLVLGAGLAGADSKKISDSSSDAATESLDVIQATARHKGKKRLVHTVTVEQPLDEQPGHQILLQMNTDKDGDCEKEFIWPPSGDVSLIKCGVGETPKAGKITERTPSSLKFVFKRKVIGNPKKYGWRIETRICPQPCTDVDFAPDQDGTDPVYVKHKLK